MGATAMYRAPGQSDRDFYQENVLGEKYEIVECATVNNVFYAAVRNLTDTVGGEGAVWAFVSKLSRTRDRYGMNFCFREDDETVGPYHCEAPLRVLDALTPVEELYGPCDDYAEGKYGQVPTWVNVIRWRSACRINAAKAAARPKVSKGDTVKLAEPFKFSGGVSEDTFTLENGKRNHWRAAAGFICRLPKRSRWPDYKVVNA